MKKLIFILTIMLSFVLTSCTDDQAKDPLTQSDIETLIEDTFSNKEINFIDLEELLNSTSFEYTLESSNDTVISNDKNVNPVNSNTNVTLTFNVTLFGNTFSKNINVIVTPNLTESQAADFIVSQYGNDVASGTIDRQFTYNVQSALDIFGVTVTIYSYHSSLDGDTGFLTLPDSDSNGVDISFTLIVGSLSKDYSVKVLPNSQTSEEIFTECLDMLIAWDSADLTIENTEQAPSFPSQIVCNGGFVVLTYSSTEYTYISSTGDMVSRPAFRSGSDTQVITISALINSETVSKDYTFTIEEETIPVITQLRVNIGQNDKIITSGGYLISKDNSDTYNKYVLRAANETILIEDTTNEIVYNDLVVGEIYTFTGKTNSSVPTSDDLYMDEVYLLQTHTAFDDQVHQVVVDGYTGSWDNYSNPDYNKDDMFSTINLPNVTVSFQNESWIQTDGLFKINYYYDEANTPELPGFEVRFNGVNSISSTGYTTEEVYRGKVIMECTSVSVKTNDVGYKTTPNGTHEGYTEDILVQLNYVGTGCNYIIVDAEEEVLSFDDFNNIAYGESVNTVGIITELDKTNDTGKVYVDGYSFNITGSLSDLELGSIFILSGSKVDSNNYSVTSAQEMVLSNKSTENFGRYDTFYTLLAVENKDSSNTFTDIDGTLYREIGVNQNLSNRFHIKSEDYSSVSIGDVIACSGKIDIYFTYTCETYVNIDYTVYLEGSLSTSFSADYDISGISTDGDYDVIAEVVSYNYETGELIIDHNGQITVNVNQDCSLTEKCFSLSTFETGEVVAFTLTKSGSNYDLKYYSKAELGNEEGVSINGDGANYFVQIDMSKTFYTNGKLYLAPEEVYNLEYLKKASNVEYIPYLNVAPSDITDFINNADYIYLVGSQLADPVDGDLNESENTRIEIKGNDISTPLEANYFVVYK